MQIRTTGKKLVFVIGYPRSGTTMLASWMTGFPNVTVTPETHFFNDLFDSHIFPRRKKKKHILQEEAFERLRFQDLKLTKREIDQEMVNSKIRREEFFQICLNAFCQRSDADLIVEKTPEHLFHLRQILTTFPEAKIIAIVRDPRDCLLSLKDTPWSQRSDIHNMLEWQWSHRLLKTFVQKNTDQMMKIHYEDFLEKHHDSARKIADFIGKDIAKWSQDRVSKNAIPMWESAWKANASTAINTGHKYRWHSAPKEFVEQVDHLIGSEINAWGYKAGKTQLQWRLLAWLFPLLPWLRRWRIKLTYGTGFTKDLPSERFLTKLRAKNN